MSTKPMQLEGRVVEPGDARAEEFSRLRARVRDLSTEVEEWRGKYESLWDNTIKYEAALKALRRQLGPLYNSLQMVFGDLDAVISEEPPAVFGGATPSAPSPDRYEQWKRKLGGKTADAITALQSHSMTRGQVRIALASGWTTVDASLKKLRDLGLIEKVDGKFRLML